MTSIASWEREFEVWDFSVSYSRLLLRSLRDTSPTRVDVLFSNVRFMHLPTQLEQLRIDLVAGHSFGGVDIPNSVKGNWYAINGGQSYIFATHCQWHEDEGNFKSESQFGPFARTD
ncbi:hypothetical protein Aph02nite_34050 [Actinoplanes philippinensis]|uniref:Uncharacterized protein n=1 Tax=Actinoplanes philippinensis TaxID=35752 RepID=A0A1I2F600_9ACTN|nr:hypothetical protein Aph02nite_34050 [Actinoplanes philippinensis]SFF00046.1 hypothetical protein SAMN05421541_10598 [Actinoplanes philippinensis]